ncbi:hypothetical protein [Paraburkholderia aromaticivorans]|uniref:hypothetical protein n=1 Tax=Paraburkholderia aromaticivorans TaxID=2026199 RepID=UPI001455E983|nr:hypothetical protein [Paraburkholderia aromaticivorans]
MKEGEAKRRTQEALRTASARAGDNEEGVKAELLRMVQREPALQEAFQMLGITRLWESQNLRH